MLPNHTPSKIQQRLQSAEPNIEPSKILVLFGSLRPNSFSRLLANQVMEILEHFGAEVRLFDPIDLPIYDGVSQEHPKVQQLRDRSAWSQGQVWISPEIHGNISAVFKNQIDWLPLEQSACRTTQGKTLAVMQISGGSQSFNTVNNLRVLGRWMRMFTIPNQSSIAKAWQEFDDHGRLKDSSFRDRVIDVLEELVKTTILLRGQSDYLTERFSETKSNQSLEVEASVKNLVAASGAA
ncbi:arsenical resistance protein ArsH [Microbulbifer sp. OS29]|uniref:Arsenical resistance protein ArsH n=1 Tax=Microbulbifer okhotskensis TaxID=2926617 RepID=A0A9X2EPB4_9GAMM|nr:arsenical resistance protein ArsH [Microbulbifer okhotskensis]MCO1335962.1 arsenical resistance protein ArsH [Microbulbifer okhotskensis]